MLIAKDTEMTASEQPRLIDYGSIVITTILLVPLYNIMFIGL